MAAVFAELLNPYSPWISICTNELSVEKFLKEQALTLHELNCARTWLYFDDAQNITGFFTLFNDHVQVGKNKKDMILKLDEI